MAKKKEKTWWARRYKRSGKLILDEFEFPELWHSKEEIELFLSPSIEVVRVKLVEVRKRS